jgi:iron complex outermembrane recepter protein
MHTMAPPRRAKRFRNSTALVGVLAALLLATAAPAYAQTEAPAAQEEEEIVVTGSRLRQRNLETTSPVTQVTAEDITTQGVTRVEDLTNELPQVFASQGSNVSNGASGTAEVDLRGLGAARTLVLIDGRRMGIGSPNSYPSDLNQIPGPLVERVEVLTGGASAVYGSDAIAGVVNFIMRDDFEGFRIDAQYGFFQHNNDFDEGFLREEIAFRGQTNPQQFQLPEDDVIDGYGKEISAIWGTGFEDGRGHLTAYLGYRNNDAVLQRDRDYSACALNPSLAIADDAPRPYAPAGAVRWDCGGSGTSFPGLFTDFATYEFTVDQNTGAFVPFTDDNLYNFGPLNYFQRPDERYTAGAFAQYDINDRATAYGNFMFSDYSSVAQIAPSGTFFTTSTINCGNPLLTPANAAAIGCSAAAIAADTPTSLFIGRRNIEGGGRQDDLNYTAYRGVVGMRGALTDNWDYDVYAQYYRVSLSRSYLNDFSITRLTRALDVVDADPGAAVDPQCRTFVSGVDSNCVPYDIFTPNSVTPEALAYLQVPLLQRGEATQQNVVATVNGELPVKSLWAEEGLQSAFGIEYRRDTIDQTVDENFATGNAAGQGGPTLPLSGNTDAFEVFGELRMPIMENVAFADLLSVDAAYRFSSYGSGIETDTYKLGAEWAPVEALRFRGSFQRAVRAPNIIELFTSQGFGLFDMTDDPCDLNDPGEDGVGDPAICQGTLPYQVTPGQAAGSGLNSPAGQYNALLGGNPDLTPEEADTYTVGFVYQPDAFPLTVSLDYFNIEVANLITSVAGQLAVNTVNDCYVNGNLDSCNRIVRNPGTGQLWIGQGRVEDLSANIGGLQTSGVDLNADYEWELGDTGSLRFNLVGTWLEELTTDPGAGAAPYDCVGGFGADLCGLPTPEWRHRFRVSWETPWNVDLHGTWRYIGEVEQRGADNTPVTDPEALDASFDAVSYFDVAGTWEVRENTAIRFGVNNILDKDPPISANVGTGFGNGNTYPQLYDANGRWAFVGVTMDF